MDPLVTKLPFLYPPVLLEIGRQLSFYLLPPPSPFPYRSARSTFPSYTYSVESNFRPRLLAHDFWLQQLCYCSNALPLCELCISRHCVRLTRAHQKDSPERLSRNTI
uniref:Uncharacterized protein ORF106_2 n=1 Tax=Nothoceros aenigmaticus TaxID=13813 RepID=C3RYP1_9EMBR|nr:hypothetical protein MeaeMp38 [Nothoceros aenigmaticus]ACC86797.1 hypothetical protein MeaeMp38 [Nothoceros aenigmaticus]